MLAAARFLLGELSLAALGAGAAFHPSVRSMSFAARAAAAMGAGAVALTLEATLYSIAGIPWTVPGLGIPLLLLSLLCALWWRGRPTPPRVAQPALSAALLAAGAASARRERRMESAVTVRKAIA
jgi:hypothetical protein